ncbi:unnamed protein product [Didymodactylos carnosus]|uniref:Uncharacterized protein n=1 Tax=Didymodactylos carnosus TaxID=1234261 RepID=A0A813ZR62_9BILA|nr:unnamed protein product [Didymodactylos carnosus]CAF1211302.1 unnamed protein product [Didymodactylos carnosus]CAF3684955.1 unnamed protein product [Didymodactylos carnosus]CAF4020150.1 unnamed protein product [Didymodactylos carnosus]
MITTKERIKEYLEEERMEEAKKEDKYLSELEQLQLLNQEIRALKSDAPISKDSSRTRLHDLEQKLTTGLNRYKIQDVTKLPEKIIRMKQRINEHQDTERMEEAEKESQCFTELEQLKSLGNQIEVLKHVDSNNEY